MCCEGISSPTLKNEWRNIPFQWSRIYSKARNRSIRKQNIDKWFALACKIRWKTITLYHKKEICTKFSLFQKKKTKKFFSLNNKLRVSLFVNTWGQVKERKKRKKFFFIRSSLAGINFFYLQPDQTKTKKIVIKWGLCNWVRMCAEARCTFIFNIEILYVLIVRRVL